MQQERNTKTSTWKLFRGRDEKAEAGQRSLILQTPERAGLRQHACRGGYGIPSGGELGLGRDGRATFFQVGAWKRDLVVTSKETIILKNNQLKQVSFPKAQVAKFFQL